MKQITLGEKIKELRIKSGLTQMQVHYETGISQATISLNEKGHCRPSVENLKKLAKVFNVEPIELIQYYVTD